MLTIRAFTNLDPPALLDIWRRNANSDPLHYRPLSMDFFQEHVLGLPYFDYDGMQLALEDGKAVGFAHASFGPNKAGSNIDLETGVICLVMVVPNHPDPGHVVAELIAACEKYLKEKGAKRIYGGSSRPCAPFYMGLYGGSEPLGVFESDQVLFRRFSDSGYKMLQKTIRFRVDLPGYQVPMSPAYLKWRRKLFVEFNSNPVAPHWWQACMMCRFQWVDAFASESPGGEPIAKASFRLMNFGNEYFASRHASVMDIVILDKDYLRQGVGTYLLGESIRHLMNTEYVSILEGQAAEDDVSTVSLLKRLGLVPLETGAIFVKDLE